MDGQRSQWLGCDGNGGESEMTIMKICRASTLAVLAFGLWIAATTSVEAVPPGTPPPSDGVPFILDGAANSLYIGSSTQNAGTTGTSNIILGTLGTGQSLTYNSSGGEPAKYSGNILIGSNSLVNVTTMRSIWSIGNYNGNALTGGCNSDATEDGYVAMMGEFVFDNAVCDGSGGATNMVGIGLKVVDNALHPSLLTAFGTHTGQAVTGTIYDAALNGPEILDGGGVNNSNVNANNLDISGDHIMSAVIPANTTIANNTIHGSGACIYCSVTNNATITGAAAGQYDNTTGGDALYGETVFPQNFTSTGIISSFGINTGFHATTAGNVAIFGGYGAWEATTLQHVAIFGDSTAPTCTDCEHIALFGDAVDVPNATTTYYMNLDNIIKTTGTGTPSTSNTTVAGNLSFVGTLSSGSTQGLASKTCTISALGASLTITNGIVTAASGC